MKYYGIVTINIVFRFLYAGWYGCLGLAAEVAVAIFGPRLCTDDSTMPSLRKLCGRSHRTAIVFHG